MNQSQSGSIRIPFYLTQTLESSDWLNITIFLSASFSLSVNTAFEVALYGEKKKVTWFQRQFSLFSRFVCIGTPNTIHAHAHTHHANCAIVNTQKFHSRHSGDTFVGILCVKTFHFNKQQRDEATQRMKHIKRQEIERCEMIYGKRVQVKLANTTGSMMWKWKTISQLHDQQRKRTHVVHLAKKSFFTSQNWMFWFSLKIHSVPGIFNWSAFIHHEPFLLLLSSSSTPSNFSLFTFDVDNRIEWKVYCSHAPCSSFICAPFNHYTQRLSRVTSCVC